MFSHIMLGANDLEKSKAFYDATLGVIGCKPGFADPKGRVFYMTPTGVFAITKPFNGEPASCGNGSTIGSSSIIERSSYDDTSMSKKEHIHLFYDNNACFDHVLCVMFFFCFVCEMISRAFNVIL